MNTISPAAPNTLLPDDTRREAYRDYADEAQPGMARVRAFYRNNHAQQTYAFVQEKKARWLKFDQREMTPREGLDFLKTAGRHRPRQP